MAQELRIRVDERARELAEKVLAQAGVSLDVAINRYLCAIAVTKHLPYKEDIQLPEDHPKEKQEPISLEHLGKQVSENFSAEGVDPKRIFAEIERRYGL